MGRGGADGRRERERRERVREEKTLSEEEGEGGCKIYAGVSKVCVRV